MYIINYAGQKMSNSLPQVNYFNSEIANLFSKIKNLL